MLDKARSLITAMIGLLVLAIVFHLLVAGAGHVSLLDPDTPLRFAGALVVGVLAFAASYAAGENDVWRLDVQYGVYAVIAAVVSGVVRWFFAGNTFDLPAFQQVTLQLAWLPVVVFGIAFGPVVGFVAGAGGSLLANLFAGWVLPQVDFALGLAGLIAGMATVVQDGEQRRVVLMSVAGVLGAATFGLYLAYRDVPLSAPPGSAPQPPTLLLGASALLAAGIASAVRYAFPTRRRWATLTLWGVLGVFAAQIVRALLLIVTDRLTLARALTAEYLAGVGAGTLAVALLLPLLLGIYEWYSALPDIADEAGVD